MSLTIDFNLNWLQHLKNGEIVLCSSVGNGRVGFSPRPTNWWQRPEQMGLQLRLLRVWHWLHVEHWWAMWWHVHRQSAMHSLYVEPRWHLLYEKCRSIGRNLHCRCRLRFRRWSQQSDSVQSDAVNVPITPAIPLMYPWWQSNTNLSTTYKRMRSFVSFLQSTSNILRLVTLKFNRKVSSLSFGSVNQISMSYAKDNKCVCF